MFLQNYFDYNAISNKLMKAFLALGGLLAAIFIEYLVIHVVTLQGESFPYPLFLATLGIIAFIVLAVKHKIVSV